MKKRSLRNEILKSELPLMRIKYVISKFKLIFDWQSIFQKSHITWHITLQNKITTPSLLNYHLCKNRMIYHFLSDYKVKPSDRTEYLLRNFQQILLTWRCPNSIWSTPVPTCPRPIACNTERNTLFSSVRQRTLMLIYTTATVCTHRHAYDIKIKPLKKTTKYKK